jgi:hypothetical protein
MYAQSELVVWKHVCPNPHQHPNRSSTDQNTPVASVNVLGGSLELFIRDDMRYTGV